MASNSVHDAEAPARTQKQIASRFHIRITSLFGLLVLLGGFVLAPAPAEAKYASFVIDAQTGQVLHSVNADTRNYPASLTKMMTLYMMFEALDEGRLRMDDRIMMSRRAARQPPSKLGIKPGHTFSVETAIRALAVKSANDVAAAVSEHIGGTERQFALLMTAKARKLGMASTTFRNASGLPHRGQLSTARDMATLAKALLTHFPTRYHYFSQPKFKHGDKTYRSHNKLLTTYEGTDGIKTGYIRASGFNLVASVKRGPKRLIGVVFGAKNSKTRNRHMVKLLDKGWAKVYPSTVQAKAKPKAKTKKRTVWGVQIGAYKTYEPAYAIAVRAMGLAPSYLSKGDVHVEPLRKKNGKVLYRGRVLGISKTQAYRACKFLKKKKKMGCMPLTTSSPSELASLN
ncbi:D-alanyl-D-alanine carboxypeptidase family protein [Magnetovibrio sp. PR-2]|uniref:D-alanyl-D-alanine carboxypeptidase family protein n=1 Tax=Magnetovibrio sp. PR-2 TaxID=3120356 RepID=UPI002FCE4292